MIFFLILIFKYLWNYEKIMFINGLMIVIMFVVIGVYGDKGVDGKVGKDGKILYIWCMYVDSDKGDGIFVVLMGKCYFGLVVNRESVMFLINFSDYIWLFFFEGIEFGGCNYIDDYVMKVMIFLFVIFEWKKEVIEDMSLVSGVIVKMICIKVGIGGFYWNFYDL